MIVLTCAVRTLRFAILRIFYNQGFTEILYGSLDQSTKINIEIYT